MWNWFTGNKISNTSANLIIILSTAIAWSLPAVPSHGKPGPCSCTDFTAVAQCKVCYELYDM